MEKVWLKQYPEHIQKEINIPDDSVPDMLQKTIANYGNRPALHFYGKEINYKAFGKQAAAFASSLQQTGLQKGDRAAIMLPNCPQYCISYYGILQAGGTVTQVNPMLLGKELAYILKDSGAESIVIYEPLLPVLNEIIEQTAIKHVIKVNLEGRDYQEWMGVPFRGYIKRARTPPKTLAITPS